MHLRQELKAALGLLITVLAVATKLSAYLGTEFAAVFNSSAVSIGLLILMALGLFMFAYYSMPEKPAETAAGPQVAPSVTPQTTINDVHNVN